MILIVAIDLIDFKRNGCESFVRDYNSNNYSTYVRKILEIVVADLGRLQWVTGIAILITGFFRACHLTVYHWNIISYMAILSAVTQTATFIVLSAEWRKYSWVRGARYLGTIAMFLMLSCAICMKYWTKGWSFGNGGDARWPALCFFRPNHESPVSNPSREFGWKLEVLMVPWMFIAFATIYQELFRRIKRRTLRNLVYGTINFAFPILIGFLSAKRLWDARAGFVENNYLSDETEDQWSFGQIVPLVLLLSTMISLLQSWNSKYHASNYSEASSN